MVISQHNLPETQKKPELIHTFCSPQCSVNYHRFKLKCGKSSGPFNTLRFRASRRRTPAENTCLCSLLSRHERWKVSPRWAKLRLGWRGRAVLKLVLRYQTALMIRGISRTARCFQGFKRCSSSSILWKNHIPRQAQKKSTCLWWNLLWFPQASSTCDSLLVMVRLWILREPSVNGRRWYHPQSTALDALFCLILRLEHLIPTWKVLMRLFPCKDPHNNLTFTHSLCKI